MTTKTEMLCPEGHKVKYFYYINEKTKVGKTYHCARCASLGINCHYQPDQCTAREVEGEH